MATTFEDFIIKCCKAPEWELRKWITKILTRNGFTIFEDDYVSDRAKIDERYKTVHNLLAIRGDKPKVCLVAHTDVCRDHDHLKKDKSYFSYQYGQLTKDSEEKKDLVVKPVLKEVIHKEKMYRIITDENNDVQVGGDDRLGVAINLWIALNTGYDMGLLFTTDEEIGLVSASKVSFKQLKDFNLAVQVDRGNHSDELVIQIGGNKLCDYQTATRLLEIAFDNHMPRKPVNGGGTDVAVLKRNDMVKNAVNMTCGYHSSYGASANEYIDVEEARSTMKFVSSIIKDYDLNG